MASDDFYWRLNFEKWDGGCMILTHEEEVAYLKICNKIADLGGPIPDTEPFNRALAAYARLGWNKWNKVKAALAAKKKIIIEGGSIIQNKALEEVEFRAQARQKRAESRENQKSGENSGEISEKKSEKKQEISKSSDGNALKNIDAETHSIESRAKSSESSGLLTETPQEDRQLTLVSDNPDRETDADFALRIWREVCVPAGLPEVRVFTDKRRKGAKARIAEVGRDEWRRACALGAASSFCRGESESGWKLDFDDITNPTKLTRLLEGKYDDRDHGAENRKLDDAVERRRQGGRELLEHERAGGSGFSF